MDINNQTSFWLYISAKYWFCFEGKSNIFYKARSASISYGFELIEFWHTFDKLLPSAAAGARFHTPYTTRQQKEELCSTFCIYNMLFLGMPALLACVYYSGRLKMLMMPEPILNHLLFFSKKNSWSWAYFQTVLSNLFCAIPSNTLWCCLSSDGCCSK